MARSAWLRHVMAVRGKNKGMAFKDVLKLAKRSYKKGGGMQGGDKFESQPASVGGDAPEDAPSNNNASKGAGMEGGEPTEAPQQEGGRRRRRRGSRKSRRKSRKGKSRKKSRKGKSRKGRKTKRRRRRRR